MKSKNWFDFHSGSVNRLSRGDGSIAGSACFAGKPARRGAPEIEIGLAELRLQFRRPLVVRQPVFRDGAEGLHHLGDFARRLVAGFAALARLEIGRERLAAALHRLREVHREGFGIEFFRDLGFGADFTHARTL